jgi:thioredoxin reductase
MIDALIVGGGPAGLSAALLLGRCRRQVLVLDEGRPRNAASPALHGFLTRDGIAPAELLRLAREQLAPYTTVEHRRATVVDARRVPPGFEVELADGERIAARKLLLATGVIDLVPDVEGIGAFYGTSVFHCPYCDGWEFRGQELAIYGRGENGAGLALDLTTWSRHLTLVSDGPAELAEPERARLERHGIAVREEKVARLEGEGGMLARVVFEDGAPVACRALFFSTGEDQRSPLPGRLGCTFTEKGAVETGDSEATCVPGLFVAGDASPRTQLVIMAAAEGAQAGMAIHKALLAEELAAREA